MKLKRNNKRGRPKGVGNAEPQPGSFAAEAVRVINTGKYTSVREVARRVECSPQNIIEAIQRWHKLIDKKALKKMKHLVSKKD